jgi:hypothetical protein
VLAQDADAHGIGHAEEERDRLQHENGDHDAQHGLNGEEPCDQERQAGGVGQRDDDDRRAEPRRRRRWLLHDLPAREAAETAE